MYRHFVLLIELSYFGIVCQKLLFVLTLWIHLRIDWIHLGKTKKFCAILKLTFLPAVELKSVLVTFSVISDHSAVNCGQQQPGPLSLFELELNLVVAPSQSADQTFETASLST